MLVLQNITYTHANKDVLFENIHLSINNKEKIALIGNNGSGKSTLLQIIAGILKPSQGTIALHAKPYYIPQLSGHDSIATVAEALHVSEKLHALNQILAGNATEKILLTLDDDWSIEARCNEALKKWGLKDVSLFEKMETLSGGEKTKVLLAGIAIHNPEIILLDEPSNHLDMEGRKLLYAFIETTPSTLIVVSHDRVLLNKLNTVCELTKYEITTYGGKYDFYAEQKRIEHAALSLDIKSKARNLRKAKEVERDTMERQQKLDARGKKKQEKAGLPTISMKTFKNNAEKSTARTKDIHAEKIHAVSSELNELRSELPDADKIKLGFDQSRLHKGKILISATGINAAFAGQPIWKQSKDVQICSGERIGLNGINGSGKTTLVKMLLGEQEPASGTIYNAVEKTIYVDQEYSLINSNMSIYDQAVAFNVSGLQEHEIKIRLNRFLFTKDYWDNICNTLSGGEKMRLMLCCLTILTHAPDMIVLDEPTNNLDIQNIEILTHAINTYKGTLLVISHDTHFLDQIQIERIIDLNDQ